jgi:hypothetical protein
MAMDCVYYSECFVNQLPGNQFLNDQVVCVELMLEIYLEKQFSSVQKLPFVDSIVQLHFRSLTH